MNNCENKISSFQIMTLTSVMGASLFIGLGTYIIFNLARQDAWLVSFFSFFVVLIPYFFIIYIMNYQPEKIIFQKTKLLFGNIIGNIINLVLTLYILLIGVIVTWSASHFAITQYLIKTPPLVTAIIFILPAIYAVTKGIETICRTSQMFFYLIFISITVILYFLSPHIDFFRLKPYFISGGINMIENSLLLASYLFVPLITILSIPKNKVIEKKSFNYFLLGGIGFGTLSLFMLFVSAVSTVGIELISLYRYPEYYVLQKVEFLGFFTNVENILSLHIYLYNIMMLIMSIYFIFIYIKETFKLKKENNNKWYIIMIGIIIIILSQNIFENCSMSLIFMEHYFPYYVSIVLLFLLFIITVTIFFKSLKKRKSY